jgi:hypothetical protein
MSVLSHQRCFNHALREAVARCPDCGRFFCRECVTEHDERVVCSACLKKHARKPLLSRRGFAVFSRAGQFLLGLLMAWFFFYVIGDGLIRLPAAFHEGSIWRVNWMDQP